MKITIDAQGKVSPPDSTMPLGPIWQLVKPYNNPAWANVPTDLLIFVCTSCLQSFTARGGEETVHECGSAS
jgi:hypothetical protein